MDNLKRYKINEIENKIVYGRTIKNASPLPLFWTGSGIEFNVKASELWIEIESDYDLFEQWMSVEINGELISRQMIQKGKNDICLFRGLNSEVVKNVHIYKDVQAMPGDEKSLFLIHSLSTDGSFETVDEKNLKIEFIGDSITSGEGSIGAKIEQDWTSIWFTALNNYAVITSKLLNAEYSIISQSGYGVLAAWDNNPNNVIPKYYEKICGVLSGDKNKELGALSYNNFESWKPDYIVVNLGTNDFAAFYNNEWKDEETGEIYKLHLDENGSYSKEDTQKFEDAIVKFLYKLRKYNKDSHIIWGYGMLGITLLRYIYRAVETYKNETNDEKVTITQLPSANDKTVGSRSHPGLLCHKAAAETLANFITELRKNN